NLRVGYGILRKRAGNNSFLTQLSNNADIEVQISLITRNNFTPVNFSKSTKDSTYYVKYVGMFQLYPLLGENFATWYVRFRAGHKNNIADLPTPLELPYCFAFAFRTPVYARGYRLGRQWIAVDITKRHGSMMLVRTHFSTDKRHLIIRPICLSRCRLRLSFLTIKCVLLWVAGFCVKLLYYRVFLIVGSARLLPEILVRQYNTS
ncbi:unnamed protein product, partial [Hymenolepis diminuta]